MTVHRLTAYSPFFDQQSYVSVVGTSSIRITPYKHLLDMWAWWALRMSGGTTPTFLIAKVDHYNMVAGERLCCWATQADTDTWYDFENVSIGANDLEFSMNTPFPAGTIYVAALPMYPFSRVQRMMNVWGGSRWVGETTSTTNYIIGNATVRAVGDGSGRTAPALPFYGFKITGDRVGDKNKAILAAYSHATETPGLYTLEGAINYLLGASAEAETLRDYFEFYVYPCTNPQGVWSGWWRSSPEVPEHSHDYMWDETGSEESIDVFKAAMSSDTGGSIDFGFDYHSFMSSTDIHATAHTGDTGGNYAYFTTEMQALDADFNLTNESLAKACTYYLRSLGASLALAIEQGGELARGIPEYKTFGENTMKALYEMLIDGRFTYEP